MNNQLQEIEAKLGSAQSVLVVIPVQASQDVVAAATALYLSLAITGKAVAIVSSTLPVVRDSHLVGIDKVTTSVGGNNLVITLNVPEEAIDKVTSNTEGGHLNLVIMPQKGQAALTAADVIFGTSGAAADLIIVVGAQTMSDIGALADKEIELFQKERIVNVSHQLGEFGAINLTDPSSSCSELVTALLQELKLPLDLDIANNLMQGIEAGTDNLTSPNMTADTFEALAVLYRTGARRHAPAVVKTEAKIIADMPIVDHGDSSDLSAVRREAKDRSELPDPASADWTKPKIYRSKQ
jgi:nanoRNase/pAp phosphatase (c-di-AMP/oligoRNAs hydrolase)